MGTCKYCGESAGFLKSVHKECEMKPIGTGLFAVTNKNIYFSSSSKSLKIPINKILTIDQYEDGIGIHKLESDLKKHPVHREFAF